MNAQSLDKRKKGLYAKFRVERTDGKSEPGEKHDGCKYLVLDMSCDPHAIPAAMAYAKSCADDYPLLARDVRQWARARAENFKVEASQ